MKNDVLLKAYKKEADLPDNILDIAAHVSTLKDFYLKNSQATTPENVDNFIKNLNVFDYIDFFKKAKRKHAPKVVKEKVVEKKQNVKTFRVTDTRNPKMLILQDTTEKLVIKNPPFRKHKWEYKNLRSTPCCYSTGAIGDVVYRIYIDGQQSYYFLVNSPTDLDKLGIRNTYLRMFEYGRYRLSDVRLEAIRKYAYVKSTAVKYEKI